MKKGVSSIFLRVSRSRKGLSPLIATVLLIAFAVALGVMVMNWGKGGKAPVTPPPAPGANGEVTVKVDAYTLDKKTLLCFDPTSYNLRPESAEYQFCNVPGAPAGK